MPNECAAGQYIYGGYDDHFCLDYANVKAVTVTAANVDDDSAVTSYAPGGVRRLHATLTLKDGKVLKSSGEVPWGQLQAKTNFGKVANDNGLIVFDAGDLMQNLGQDAVINFTVKDTPSLATTLTLPPDYSSGQINASGGGGNSTLSCRAKGQRGQDGFNVTATLSEMKGPGGRAFILVKAALAGGSTESTIFDPAKGRLKIMSRGGPGGDGGAHVAGCDMGDGGAGGRGGKVTVIYPAKRPDLKNLVTVDTLGGEGGAPNGDPGGNGPDPVFKAGS